MHLPHSDRYKQRLKKVNRYTEPLERCNPVHLDGVKNFIRFPRTWYKINWEENRYT